MHFFLVLIKMQLIELQGGVASPPSGYSGSLIKPKEPIFVINFRLILIKFMQKKIFRFILNIFHPCCGSQLVRKFIGGTAPANSKLALSFNVPPLELGAVTRSLSPPAGRRGAVFKPGPAVAQKDVRVPDALSPQRQLHVPTREARQRPLPLGGSPYQSAATTAAPALG